MTTHHTNICANNCIYAKKAMWLSRAGESVDWLYRCTKLEDRIITTDSVIQLLGCATFTTGISGDSKDDLVKRAQEMLDEINKKIEVDKKKEVPVIAPVQEQVKPVEKPPEPVVVPAPPTTTTTNSPLVHSTPTPQVTITEEQVKKKRGRKPKHVPVVEPPVVESAKPAGSEPKKEEVSNDVVHN